jgi:small subunit ribosomal protein S18
MPMGAQPVPVSASLHLSVPMSSSFFKKRLSPIKPGDPIDYKDVDLLKKFITERGKILPRRLTGLTARQQRDLTNAVKRARIVALLPFVNPEG